MVQVLLLKERLAMSLILAMSAFALVMSVTPGPVNIVTLTSGANYGVARTLPFVSGATVGFTALLLVLGLGAAQLLESAPDLMRLIGALGAAFILYMAFKLVTADGALSESNGKRPGFTDGVLMQWLNPKAWIACVSGIAAFTTQNDFSSLALFCTLYFFICYAGVGVWAVIGRQAQFLIRSETRLKGFNRVMGAALAGVGVYLLVL